MRVIHLGAFGFFPDQNARKTWCDNAASIWPNAGEREGLRTKCMANHVFDPWTAVGKVTRGLPLNWSTDPKMVSGGAVNAGIGIVNEAGNQVNQTLNPPVTQTPPPPVTQTPPPQVTPGAGTVVDTGGGSIMFPGTGSFPTPGAIVAGARSNAPLIAVGVLGLGALAFLALKKKRPAGSALSGYGGRNRRRRRR
jgi:hypothetical protein